MSLTTTTTPAPSATGRTILPPLEAGDAIALCGHRHQHAHLADLGRLLAQLHSRGIRLLIEERFAAYLRDTGTPLPDGAEARREFPADARLLLSIGGDGTLLRAAHWAGTSGTPILGINTGHLGFLATYSLPEADTLLRSLFTPGGLAAERRALLRVRCAAMPPEISPYALNEVAIMKEDTASMITVRAHIDGHFLADYLVDGLVISTPTGSTAYNLSVGGPILQPTLSCVVLSPIAPHTLTLRPIVADAGSHIDCTVSSRSGSSRVSIDGRSFRVPDGTAVAIDKAPFAVSIVQRPDDDFAATLRKKLYWGAR